MTSGFWVHPEGLKKILVNGAVGQIGSELTMVLRQRFGADNVVAAGHTTPPSPALRDSGPYETLDVTNRDTVTEVLDKHGINEVYHLAAILSGVGEKYPHRCWQVNIDGLHNILEIARERPGMRLFCPSSIAVFGPRWRSPLPKLCDRVERPTSSGPGLVGEYGLQGG